MRRRVVALFTCSSTSTSTSARLILAEGSRSNKLIRTTNTRIRMMGSSSSSDSNSGSSSSSSNSSDSGSSITADGTRMFFDWLEKKYGARYGGKPLPMMMMANTTSMTNTDNTQSQSQSQEEEEEEEEEKEIDDDDVVDDSADVVLTRNSLELNDIKKLFSHQIVALKIKNFYPSNYAIELGKELAKEGLNTNNNTNNNTNGNGNGMKNWKISTSKGLESSDVFTLGRHSPYNIAIANNGNNGNNNTNGEQEYFNEVRNELRDRRGLTLLNNNGNDDNDGNELQQQNQKKEEKLQKHPKQKHQQQQQQQKQPRLWPLDLLRLELDEIWPYGAGLARRQQRQPTGTGNNSDSDSSDNSDSDSNSGNSYNDCMGGGLPRLMIGPTRWKKGLVHVDELEPLTLNKGCFSANIYLQLPYSSVYAAAAAAAKINDDEEQEEQEQVKEQEQPVMEIWPLQIQSKWDWFRNATTLSHLTSQDPEGQVILRKVLNGNNNDNKNKNKNKNNNKYTINVHPGDLVLLCVQRPHCAIGFGHNNNDINNDNIEHSDGDNNNNVNTKNAVVMQTRVSLQCFLQYNGSKERLTIDS